MVGIASGLWSVAVWGLLIWLVWSVDGGRPVGWSGQAAHAWVADAGVAVLQVAGRPVLEAGVAVDGDDQVVQPLVRPSDHRAVPVPPGLSDRVLLPGEYRSATVTSTGWVPRFSISRAISSRRP